MTKTIMIRSTKRARRELMRVKLVHPPFPIVLMIQPFGPRMFELEMVMHLRERDTGRDYVQRFVTECAMPVSARKFVRFVEASLHEALLHELYETLHVDGKRVRDLHEGHAVGQTASVTDMRRFTFRRRLKPGAPSGAAPRRKPR